MVCGFPGEDPVNKDFEVAYLAGVYLSINR